MSHSTDGLRAIATTYRGYRFRSRLEARWAVFFDSLGVEFEYEKEGFELQSGLYYLPDFFIPSITSWIEVKGAWDPEVMDETWIKARDLAAATGQMVYVFSGQFKTPGDLVGFEFWGAEDESLRWRPKPVWWFKCPSCLVWQVGWAASELPCDCMGRRHQQLSALAASVLKAKQARFEFGERG